MVCCARNAGDEGHAKAVGEELYKSFKVSLYLQDPDNVVSGSRIRRSCPSGEDVQVSISLTHNKQQKLNHSH